MSYELNMAKKRVRDIYDLWAVILPESMMSFAHNHPFQELLEIMDPPEHSKILDVGCGAGWTSKQMTKNRNCEVIGLDFSPKMLRKAKKNNGPFKDIVLITSDVENIPWRSNYFDYLVNLESFYYYTDPLRALEEMKRVLRPNGELYVFVGVYGSKWPLHSILVRVLDWAPKRFYSKEEYLSMFEDAGFRTVRQKIIGHHLLTIGNKIDER